MSLIDAILATAIGPEQLALYRCSTKPITLRRALRRLDAIARDRQALLEQGEAVAAEGATVELRGALLDLIAVPPTSFAAQEAKNATVARYFSECDPAWLMETMMACAVKIEWQLLDITPEQEQRLRAAMPASRIA